MGVEVSANSANIAWHHWYVPVIPATWEAEIERIVVPGQHGQKVHENHLNNNKKKGDVWSMPVISATVGSMKLVWAKSEKLS
jgi:hypothetical protein